MILALAAASAGAVGYGAGSVLQARAAGTSSGPVVLRHPAYLLGVCCDLLAWTASVLATARLPLFAVESILAASLGVTVLLARPLLGDTVRRRDGLSLLGVVGALIVLALAAGTQSAQPPPALFDPAALTGMALTVGLVALCYHRAPSVWLAVLAGASFAGVAIASRALQGSIHVGT